ncbi:hypothetical protein FLAG1_04485 [Fusarium langsethiae]|uniref:RRM domain-containing protein n=1 Tax=Fusarium langsethiae TaxID=179993 RepID=A0A0N0V757_FUSLA|nr:hypothetical protein FLAG1_04485 [Fusarium langsethiae]GKU04324.1 unnamed protein product [Fusarium langsethiae]GKU17841.1 unnamed protein product [Fusarium langsethiae]
MKSKRARETAEVDEKPVVSVDAEPGKKRKREDDGADVKKAKKEKRDKKFKKESRKERKEKRKDLQDLPEQDDDVEDAQDTPMAGADDKPADTTVDVEKSAKKDKKKDKKAKVEEEKQQDASADAETKDESKKSKKNKKQDKSAETTESADAEADTADAKTNGKADRHIVFVGNLPFTATAETIKAHFASLNPIGVRCMSDPKDSKPCRGFAFVEFAKVWHMRTCLDKFHHSEFTDGTSYPRRINVELTAGGGGKTKQRQEKIKEKNVKLNENRTKRIERERIAKEESSKANADRRPAGDDGIHPSRRAHIPGRK